MAFYHLGEWAVGWRGLAKVPERCLLVGTAIHIQCNSPNKVRQMVINTITERTILVIRNYFGCVRARAPELSGKSFHVFRQSCWNPSMCHHLLVLVTFSDFNKI